MTLRLFYSIGTCTRFSQALGETHIVAENKLFLQEQGVILDAFDTRSRGRSKTIILVKNTPFDTTEEVIVVS